MNNRNSRFVPNRENQAEGLLSQLPPPLDGKGKSAAPGKTRAQLVFQGQLSPKKRRKIVRLEQWVEVRIVEGRTVTRLYPSNEELIKVGQRMLPPPEYVYRRINFPDGIPAEYAWTYSADESPSLIALGGCGVQRMTVDTWLDVIEREALTAHGHVGPTGVGNLPRPEETGGCNCPLCTQNRILGRRRRGLTAEISRREPLIAGENTRAGLP